MNFYFFHKLFNPHCHLCNVEKECPNCRQWQDMIAAEKREKKELLELILKKDVPVSNDVQVGTELPPIRKNWYSLKHQLEMDARKKALEENDKFNQTLANRSVEELEKDLAIND